MDTQNQSIIQTIFARHSIRSYLYKNIDKETINVLLQCAVRAPTAIHEEPCEFLVIQDQEVLQELSDIAKPLFVKSMNTSIRTSDHVTHDFKDPNFNIFYGADTLIVILSKQQGYYVEADCWLAAENLMLAATSMGLGTCVIGSAVEALNLPYLKELLGIAEHIRAICPIIVGFPNGNPPQSLRNDPRIVSWIS
ncbi:nitroreductase family protein [Polynucleobacter sp. JS-Fieb-80-E5]|uniref:nitroreductase family protein n=1 Tax=Polynucleobacter sp. JS-Fieb-80-E5 TaxID=2081050 RepID=UPI001C0D0787|nr:nitroreductase family protein [Polynucleobacter sp. JS-Fieb-80-E5]MBU3618172.1 nitroreductase family protein [Polynucleobacter sp. JS-Fieb-80-E5]